MESSHNIPDVLPATDDLLDVIRRLSGGVAVQERRLRAWNRFQEASDWTHRELWHYTPYKQFCESQISSLASFQSKDDAASELTEEELIPSDTHPAFRGDAPTTDLQALCIAFRKQHSGYMFFVVDGKYRSELSDETILPDGLEIRSTKEIYAQQNSLLAAALESEDISHGERLIALNRAIAEEGIALIAKKSASIALPVYVIYINDAYPAQPVNKSGVFLRSVVHLEPGATMTLFETYISEGRVLPKPSNISLEVTLERGAHLNHILYISNDRPTNGQTETTRDVNTQREDERVKGPCGASQLINLLVQLFSHAQFHSFAYIHTRGMIRRQIFIRHEGEEAQSHVHGLAYLTDTAHLDTTLWVDHLLPACISREKFRHVLLESSKAIYQGKVVVAKNAQKSDGKMKSECLLLSSEATMYNKPELEIFADDVVCGHGAVVGQLNPDEVFYLQTRGIPRSQAEALLIEAYLKDALDHVQPVDMRDVLRQKIDFDRGFKPSERGDDL